MSESHLERRRRALAQLRVTDVADPRLSREADHHLRTVLRARVGEEVVVSDGAGGWALCSVAEGGLEPLEIAGVDAAPAQCELYLPLLKGERSEWALAKAVELGVAAVVPLLARRSAVRPDRAARERVLARWRRVAEEATGQCRRTFDLVIGEPVSPAEVPAEVAVADFEGSADWRGVRAVAVGPEGGWEPDEWAPERRRVGLGPGVLRSETAAVVAAALLVAPTWGVTLEGPPMGHNVGTR